LLKRKEVFNLIAFDEIEMLLLVAGAACEPALV